MELKFTKGTDTEHEIKLDSSLISASWRCGAAIVGHPASFEVRTAFVGDGAPIKVKGKSEGGTSLGKVKGVVNANTFVGKFDVPEDIDPDDHVYFKVKLPKNGLSGVSDVVPVMFVNVRNMRWSAQEARRGDVLKLSADVYGLKDGNECIVTIYEYDRDGINDRIVELPAVVRDERIEIEWEYEYHEDTDEIPTEEEMQEYGKSYNPPEYFFTVKFAGVEFGKEQESGLLTFKDWVEIELKDREGKPVPRKDYILRLPDGQERRGTLDGDGLAREDGIPPGRCVIEFPDLEEIDSTE